ncbi:SIMPL domain-containing protein [Sphingomonas flavalba]|uniref:SIMPL domain-containing protein n=1 Tax=Sphingomonas flavalba TaxID=2559804 RepID=UPI0039DF4E01
MKTALVPLALAAAAAPLAAQTAVPVTPVAGTLLDIEATGETTRVPDVALITAGVTTTAADAATAMRDNAARVDRVVTALKRAGIADRDMQTARIALSPQYRYEQNKPPVLTGYQASNQISVRFRDIANAGPVLDALVREGANEISGPDLTLDKPEEALDEARLAAVKIARARAELYAKAAGLQVKRIVSISESGGIAQPRPVMMARSFDMAAAAPQSKVVAGEQQVGVTLSVRFELQ